MASDIWTECEQLMKQMEWHEVVSTLIDVINDKAPRPMAPPSPPPSPVFPPSPPSLLSLLSPSPPPPPTATGSEQTDAPQLVYTVLDTPMVEAPPFFVETVPLCASDVWEEHVVATTAEAEPPPGHQQQEQGDGQHAIILCDIYDQENEFGEGQYDDMHKFVGPSQINQNLRPVGRLNGEMVYEITPNDYGPRVYEAPPPFMYNPRKRRCSDGQGANEPYIKKPLNAFMIFRKEERENVMAEVKITDSATVNSILGRRWRSMSKQEQAKYYMMAKKEKQLHAQRYPNWSAVHNYGKKRRYDRSRGKAPPRADHVKD